RACQTPPRSSAPTSRSSSKTAARCRSRSLPRTGACSLRATGRNTVARAVERMRVRTADFTNDYDDIHRIRFAVFVDEQRVPEELELDDRDPECTHVLAFDDAGTAIATGRIDVDGKIGRVAVIESARRTGAGRAVMDALHE